MPRRKFRFGSDPCAIVYHEFLTLRHHGEYCWFSAIVGSARDTAIFKAGRGADFAKSLLDGAIFNGAKGNDKVTEYVLDATFHGGLGRDAAKVADCSTTEILTGVENISIVPCPT